MSNSKMCLSVEVIRVLTGGDLARRLAAAGRVRVERQYDWRKAYGAWDEVYSSPRPDDDCKPA